MGSSIRPQTLPRDRFETRAGFFCGTPARMVVGHGNNLDADQSELFKAETSNQPGSACGNAFALTRLTHPIAEVGTAMPTITLVEPGTAEQLAGSQIEDRERKVLATRPAVLAMTCPCAGIVQLVTRMTPG